MSEDNRDYAMEAFDKEFERWEESQDSLEEDADLFEEDEVDYAMADFDRAVESRETTEEQDKQDFYWSLCEAAEGNEEHLQSIVHWMVGSWRTPGDPENPEATVQELVTKALAHLRAEHGSPNEWRGEHADKITDAFDAYLEVEYDELRISLQSRPPLPGPPAPRFTEAGPGLEQDVPLHDPQASRPDSSPWLQLEPRKPQPTMQQRLLSLIDHEKLEQLETEIPGAKQIVSSALDQGAQELQRRRVNRP